MRCRDRRRRWIPLLIAAGVLPALAGSGCPSQRVRDQPPVGAEARHASPLPGSLRSSTGCPIETRFYRADPPQGEVLVVLAHGFLRRQERMVGLAEALAAAGIPTVTLSFCNSRPWDGRHIQNGRDMRRVTDQLGARKVVYVGFSAGGLSALVAAWGDPRAVGVLTLDLVDDGRLGAGLARTLRVPLLGLQGDPTPCNAQGNGAAVFAASPMGRVLPVPNANHCDFESPTDWLCESLCGWPDPGSRERRQEVVVRSVALTAELLGIEVQASAALPRALDRGALAREPGPKR